jgi:anaerobic ribonucleoside-triphosphate reductase activating protein
MRYHNITKDDMLNGDGLRVVLWVAGCTHCCKECQNPVTWDPDGGLAFDEAAKQEIWEELAKPYISGLTLSGGDPMHFKNRSQSLELAKEVKQSFPDKTIWMYTGDVWESICDDEILQYIDVLVDGEFKIEEKDTKLHWKGSANQRVIDVPASLESGDVVLHA